jgi:cystathionine beta-lyase/cystathionine gamma-synthase
MLERMKEQPQTIAARAGLEMDPGVARPIQPAIHQSTVYTYPSLESLESAMDGTDHGFVYYRNGHPNATVLEETLAALEHGQACVVAGSGMAAISSVFLSLLEAGDHVVADRNVYGGTFAILTQDLPKLGIEVSFVNAQDHAEVEAAIKPNTKLLHLESLSNPTIRVADLPALIALGHARGLRVSVDNTFASPALMNPLEHGADVVMHSLAKYIGGHGAVMGGAVIGHKDLVDIARGKLLRLGGTMAAFDAWLALIGLKTLPLRMRAHSQNALQVARFLESHPKISRVDFPGLPSHAQHDLAATLFPNGTGGMMALELHGGYDAASSFVKALVGKIPLAPSLADVSSTMSYPARTSHRALTPEGRAAIGVTDGLLRLSVGIEDGNDIVRDLDLALSELE